MHAEQKTNTTMRKTILFVSLTLLCTILFAENGKSSTDKGISMTEYFTTILKGGIPEFSNGKKIKLDRIEETRTAVWEAWKSAVNSLEAINRFT